MGWMRVEGRKGCREKSFKRESIYLKIQNINESQTILIHIQDGFCAYVCIHIFIK